MSRGKYAVRAANRLAEIDAGLVEELRGKLAEVAADRDAARAEVDLLTRQRDSEARAVAERLAADAVREATEKLAAEREAREADRQRYAAGVSQLLIRNRSLVTAPEGVWADLIDLFGLKGREIGRFMGREDADRRNSDRFRSQTLRRYGAARERARGVSVETAIRLADQS